MAAPSKRSMWVRTYFMRKSLDLMMDAAYGAEGNHQCYADLLLVRVRSLSYVGTSVADWLKLCAQRLSPVPLTS